MSQALNQLIEIITLLGYHDQSITDLSTAVKALGQIVKAEPTAIVSDVDKMITILQLYLTEHPLASMAISKFMDVIVSAIQVDSKLEDRFIRILMVCLNTLAKVPQQIPQSWLNSAYGYSSKSKSEGNPDYQLQVQVLKVFDKLIELIGNNKAASLFQPTFKQYLSINNDWRYPYFALVLISRIASTPLKLELVHFYVESAIMNLSNSYPKVRCGCLCLIGRFNYNMKQQFHQKYYQSILPPLIKLLQDPVPTVVSHAFICLSSLFCNIYDEVWLIQDCIGQILPKIIFQLKKGNVHIMQSALQTLGALSSTQNAFGPNLTQAFEIIYEVINTYSVDPKYSVVVDLCFELLAFIMVRQKRNEVQQYLPNIVALLLKFKPKISEFSFLQCWGRLCTIYQPIADINSLFHYLMEATQNLLQSQEQSKANQAIKTLINICFGFKTKMKPHSEQIIKFAKEIFEDLNKSDELKKNSIILIRSVIIKIKPSAPQYLQEWKKSVTDTIDYFFNSVQQAKQDYSQMMCLLQSLKFLIQFSIQLYSQAQIKQFALKLDIFLDKIYQEYEILRSQKDYFLSGQDQDEIPQKENELLLIEQSLGNLKRCLRTIPLIYSKLLQHKSPSLKLQLINFILQQSSLYLTTEQPWKLLEINLLITLIKKCQHLQLKEIWENTMSLFVSYSSSPYPSIRKSAMQGMGIIFLKTPIQQTQQAQIILWLSYLQNAFALPYQADSKQLHVQNCRENIVSALGKIIHQYGSKFPTLLTKEIYQRWFSGLPLNIRKEKGDIQQHYLNQLLIKNPGMILGDKQDLKSIIVEYSSFVKKRQDYKNQQCMLQTKETLKVITSWPIFKQSQEFLWSNLSKSQKNVITRFMEQ